MTEPTPARGASLIPSLRYRDANAAIAWLEAVFGFIRHSVFPGPENTVQHAELRHGSGMIMLGSASNPSPNARWYTTPGEADGRVTSPLYLVVPDCNPVWEKAKGGGAEVVMELQTMSYGGQAFAVRDPERYLWSASTTPGRPASRQPSPPRRPPPAPDPSAGCTQPPLPRIQRPMSEEASLARPYVHLLEGRDPVEVLRATPGRLSDLLKNLSADAIEQKPAPGKWGVREILCHLADCEIAWAWRLRLIYGTDNPSLQPFDQDAWARVYFANGYTTSNARATWSSNRQWNLALIEALSDTEKQRPAVHPELGPITLWSVVEIAAGHDLHHLNALEHLAPTPAQG